MAPTLRSTSKDRYGAINIIENNNDNDDNDANDNSTEVAPGDGGTLTNDIPDYQYHYHYQHERQQRMSFQILVALMASVGMLAILYGYNYDLNATSTSTSSSGTGSIIPLLGSKKHDADVATASKHKHGHKYNDNVNDNDDDHKKKDKHDHDHHHDDDSMLMPHGVNFGSWLSLEDYFYVGDTGAVEVATPNDNTVGICLPPLHVGQDDAPDWQSETDLLQNLITSTNSVAKAIQIFHAHRTTFITEADLQQLSHDLNIQHVRVPLSWCFTDHDPESTDYSAFTDDELLEMFTCKDPYYYADEGVIWPAIPRNLLERFLKSCAKFGITASLDLHTYPGATSPGTFSGVWPRKPRFWDYDNPGQNVDFGRQLYKDFVTWIENLDPEALDGVLGISPMNEPAHLAGVFADIPSLDYLPPLPDDVAEAYLDELDHFKYIPNGPHLRVLLWLRDAVNVFRDSKLPSLGKQLHVNVHESVLNGALVYVDETSGGGDYEGRGNLAMHKLIAAWWSKTTVADERSDWAILDIHHYHAWAPSCLGAVDGPPSGNYTCGNVEQRNDALKRCTEWATQIYRPAVDEFCTEGTAKLMSGEFSTSTHHRVRHACNDIDSLKTSYQMQMAAAKEANVDMYYWSYKMPFGGAFKSAWSFSQLMYLLGVTNRPDVATFHCGGHIPHDGEVTDDYFVSG